MRNKDQEISSKDPASDQNINAQKNTGHKIKHTFTSIILLIVGAAIVFALARANALQALGIKADTLPSVGTREVSLTSDMVSEVIAPASQLLTTKYYYTNAETYRGSKQIGDATLPGTENVVIYTYSGTVSLGIDLSQTTYQVDNSTKTIRVTLPDVQIIANEIDQSSFEPEYESYSVLNPITLQDAYKSEDELKQEAADKVLANEELMQTALKNAQNVIRDFLTSADATKDYTVTFASVDEVTNDGEADGNQDDGSVFSASHDNSTNSTSND